MDSVGKWSGLLCTQYTNLNTSALATESGGNLDAIATNTTKGNLTKLLTEANDLVHTYTWLDGGAADQRISTICPAMSVAVVAVPLSTESERHGLASWLLCLG